MAATGCETAQQKEARGLMRIPDGRWVPKGTRYDAVWLDIWDTIGGDNLPEMTKLKRRFSRHTNWLGCWAERDCKLAKKREL